MYHDIWCRKRAVPAADCDTALAKFINGLLHSLTPRRMCDCPKDECEADGYKITGMLTP